MRKDIIGGALGTACLLTVMLASMMLFSSHPTRAAGGEPMSCTAPISGTFTPGINTSMREITAVVNQVVMDCPNFGEGKSTLEETIISLGKASCLSIIGKKIDLVKPAVSTLHWPIPPGSSTGETSQTTWKSFSGANDKSSVAFVASGTITAGKYSGYSAALKMEATVDISQCFFMQGLTHANGIGTLTFAPTTL